MKGVMMKKWYVNFRTRTGHTNTHRVEADNLAQALSFAAIDYSKLQSIRLAEAHLCMTDAGLME